MAKRSSKPKLTLGPNRNLKAAGAKTPKKQGPKRTKEPMPPAVPTLHFTEQMLAGVFAVSKDPVFNAQQIAYDAMTAYGDGDVDAAFDLAMQAAHIDADCVDALHLIAEIDCPDDQSFLTELQEIVERGERALGKRFFKENAGYFWGLIETRPYMRARAALAELLVEAGQREEAMQHYEAMLRLNPNDNQGLRYVLLGHYLTLDRLDGAKRLFDEYPNEGSAFFAWGRALERFLANDLKGAAAALAAARECNRHVEKYLIGKKKVPKTSPDFYSPGQDNEAVICMMEIGEAWRSHPAAIEWLKEQKPITKRN